MKLSTSAFENGGYIPQKYTGDGADVSPPLQWSGAPEETASFALICDDPDAPAGTWVHWVLFGLPADINSLSEGVAATRTLPNGAKQGINDFGSIGYGGPAPPRGPAHRYYFKLYALDSDTSLEPGATKQQLLKAMQGKIIAEVELMGRYQR